VPEGCNGCCPKSWISGPPLAPPNAAEPHSKLLVGPEKTCESSRIGPNWILRTQSPKLVSRLQG
jgi:hypothetical protein